MTSLFVAGAHTDVGKTHVACALIRAARKAGLAVEVLKPLVSGIDETDWTQSDPGRLLTALGARLDPDALEAISPWRYRAPLAPPMAARLEGRTVDLAEVADYCRRRMAASSADLMIVEGVGGLMSPLSETQTGLDLMRMLEAPALLVGGGYLGTISHTLTAVEVLRARNMPPMAVVVSESDDPEAPSFPETVETLTRFCAGLPVIAAPRGADEGWAQRLLAVVRA